MPPPIPIGYDDFRKLRELGLAYVDKSHLIRELLDRPGSQVTLLPRPRRFGKSLNLSMLRWFFEKRDEDLSGLFRDLSIWQAGDAYRAHFQRYPVIHLSFKGTKAATFEETWASLRKRIEGVFEEHAYLLESDHLTDNHRRDFRAVLEGRADAVLYRMALLDLSACLRAHHGENVVILIDEYDEPIHSGHASGYAREILAFMRAFFIDGLKGNPHIFRAVLTGILRVSKESLFSGANNFGVYTLLARPFRTCFGFTEAEVLALLAQAEKSDKLPEVRAWYNGYLFGGQVVYNPWSVMSYLDRADETPRAYWLATSSNDLVRELLERWAPRLDEAFAGLLDGAAIEQSLDESFSLDALATEEIALWSLLVFTGYLKAEEAGLDAIDRLRYRLSIPNREVRQIFGTTFRGWITRALLTRGGDVAKLTQALLGGDAEELERQLQLFAENLLSHHDTVVDPERVYQGFVIGLLAVLEPDYQVRSNRESGHGRPDVIVRPRVPGKPGAVLELKLARKGKKTPAVALREGLAQIRDNDYGAELRAAGATAVHAFAVAFDGKRVWVRSAEDPPRPAPEPRPRQRPSSKTRKPLLPRPTRSKRPSR